jgi:hypothetical protein
VDTLNDARRDLLMGRDVVLGLDAASLAMAHRWFGDLPDFRRVNEEWLGAFSSSFPQQLLSERRSSR